MSINIVWIIVIVSMLTGGAVGFKRGLIEGIMRLVTTLLGIIVLVILAKGIGNFLQGSYINVLMAFILLAVLRIFHRIGKLILDSCKLVSKLPVIHSLDKVAGMILGFVEAIIFIWLVFLFIAVMNPFGIQEWLMEQVNQSVFLSLLYKTNGLILILQKFLKI
ncbi:MAG: CvpA family protein [Lachnospiraceae bacterium]|nr:CvpA family protein [Lachnospiraceae bacterium]